MVREGKENYYEVGEDAANEGQEVIDDVRDDGRLNRSVEDDEYKTLSDKRNEVEHDLEKIEPATQEKKGIFAELKDKYDSYKRDKELEKKEKQHQKKNYEERLKTLKKKRDMKLKEAKLEAYKEKTERRYQEKLEWEMKTPKQRLGHYGSRLKELGQGLGGQMKGAAKNLRVNEKMQMWGYAGGGNNQGNKIAQFTNLKGATGGTNYAQNINNVLGMGKKKSNTMNTTNFQKFLMGGTNPTVKRKQRRRTVKRSKRRRKR